LDDIYDALSLVAAMEKGDTAICIMANWRDYEVFMNEWGDLCWTGGGERIVSLDRYFINSKWKLKKMKNNG
jgi:hypothetical protein